MVSNSSDSKNFFRKLRYEKPKALCDAAEILSKGGTLKNVEGATRDNHNGGFSPMLPNEISLYAFAASEVAIKTKSKDTDPNNCTTKFAVALHNKASEVLLKKK